MRIGATGVPAGADPERAYKKTATIEYQRVFNGAEINNQVPCLPVPSAAMHFHRFPDYRI
jgi:hypothetical protein